MSQPGSTTPTRHPSEAPAKSRLGSFQPILPQPGSTTSARHPSEAPSKSRLGSFQPILPRPGSTTSTRHPSEAPAKSRLGSFQPILPQPGSTTPTRHPSEAPAKSRLGSFQSILSRPGRGGRDGRARWTGTMEGYDGRAGWAGGMDGQNRWAGKAGTTKGGPRRPPFVRTLVTPKKITWHFCSSFWSKFICSSVVYSSTLLLHKQIYPQKSFTKIYQVIFSSSLIPSYFLGVTEVSR